MDRRLTALLAVGALVLLAGCAGFTGAAADDGTDDADRTIEVVTEGEATAEPDRATIHLAVQAEGDDPETVREGLAAGDDDLRAALADWGLDDDRIRTSRYDIGETRESRTEDDVTQYRGEHRYEVTLHDVDAVGEVIDVAVEAGADDVSRIRFGLSDERETELREEALENAMDNADADAETLATHADLEIVGVGSVSTADRSVSPYTTRLADDVAVAETADAATGVETGDVSVSVSVQVVFEAE